MFKAIWKIIKPYVIDLIVEELLPLLLDLLKSDDFKKADTDKQKQLITNELKRKK